MNFKLVYINYVLKISNVIVWSSLIIWFGMVRYLGPGFTVLVPRSTAVPRISDGATVRYIQREAKKSLAGMHPIPKEFWENEHVDSRLALLYVNCHTAVARRNRACSFSQNSLDLRFWIFCPRSNQRKKLGFRA